MTTLLSAYENTLAGQLPPHSAVCIALSGGMDSCALLHVALRFAARWPVQACHVNHGISRRAEGWEEFCRQLCNDRRVPLSIHRGQPPPGGGTEQWARQLRLQAFNSVAAASSVIMAHHADDQAETVLFRMLRGSGAHGMGAMEELSAPGKVNLLRPWLGIERRDIAAYAKDKRLCWIEDEDNRNMSRRRNFLRRRVLPQLAEGFAHSNLLLAAAGRRQRDSAQLLQQLARQDEAAARQEDGGLKITYFAAAGEARLRNWLYYCLAEKQQAFSERLLHELARQLLSGDKEMSHPFGEITLHRRRGALYWQPTSPPEESRD